MSVANEKPGKFSNSNLPDRLEGERKLLSESSPEISTCESDITYSRFAYPVILLLINYCPCPLDLPVDFLLEAADSLVEVENCSFSYAAYMKITG